MIALVSIFLILQIFTIFCIVRYKREIDVKNKQLMQNYLDSKFITNNLTHNLIHTNLEHFSDYLIKKISDYYNLEQIIILDSISMLEEKNFNICYKNSVINFLKTNMYDIFNNLSVHELKSFNIKLSHVEYVLYISRLSETNNNYGLIICVVQSPALLNQDEIITLANNINLLKSRLIYNS